MNDQQRQFMTLVARPPARLNAEQTAWLLNCREYDIPVLVAARLLRPLGNPERNAPKYFAASEMLELAGDRAWLNRMTATLQQYWLHRNQRKMTCRDVIHRDDIPLQQGGRNGDRT